MSQLAERASDILKRWTDAGERHERAVRQLESQLTEFETASARMQRDAAQKLNELERVVEHEWTALRQVHEEPIRQLTEQANSLTEVAIATAHSAQRGFDQAEARLVAIEMELQQRIAELRREVQAAVSEIRGAPGLPRLGAQPSAWPLDGVTRLHQQLRQTGASAEPADVPHLGAMAEVAQAPPRTLDPPVRTIEAERAVPQSTVPPVASTPPGAPASSELSERLRLLERALDERDAQTREVAERAQRSASSSRLALGAMGVVIVLAAVLVWWTQSQVSSQLADAQRRSEDAAAAAAQDTAAAREQAARETATARELAVRAQTVTAVLAAPDLIRWNLVSAGQFSGTAQALWSASRGFVLTGSGVGPAPAGRTYQAWLLARGRVVSAGTFVPDDAGAVTLAAPPPAAGTPITSVVVSLEPVGGSARPDGPPVFVRGRLQP